MARTVHIGLAVTAHHPIALCTATFETVELLPDAGQFATGSRVAALVVALACFLIAALRLRPR